jgi:hypothetical protein
MSWLSWALVVRRAIEGVRKGAEGTTPTFIDGCGSPTTPDSYSAVRHG